jgi:hypothetical protein
MMRKDEILTIKAIAICFKPFLKPEEALIYCNLARTQFAKNCEDFGVYKNNAGYYKKDDLDRMLSGEASQSQTKAAKLIEGNAQYQR